MMDDSTRRIGELEAQLEDLEKRLGKMQVQQQKNTADLLTAEAQIGALQDAQTAMQRSVSKLGDQLGELDETMDSFTEKLAALQTAVDDNSADLDDMLTDLNTVSAEMRRKFKRLRIHQERLYWGEDEEDDEDADE